MGCQIEVFLEDNLTFTVCTHDPSTGVLTDADAPPTYRVYEEETATPILTGTMAKLDDGSTTGFYSEQIACTAANGFESGKSYNIYITAAVGGDSGGISYGFRTVPAPLEEVIEGSYTMGELLRLMASALFGKASGGGTATIIFRNLGDTGNRIVATVDANGNRTAVTLTGT